MAYTIYGLKIKVSIIDHLVRCCQLGCSACLARWSFQVRVGSSARHRSYPIWETCPGDTESMPIQLGFFPSHRLRPDASLKTGTPAETRNIIIIIIIIISGDTLRTAGGGSQTSRVVTSSILFLRVPAASCISSDLFLVMVMPTSSRHDPICNRRPHWTEHKTVCRHVGGIINVNGEQICGYMTMVKCCNYCCSECFAGVYTFSDVFRISAQGEIPFPSLPYFSSNLFPSIFLLRNRPLKSSLRSGERSRLPQRIRIWCIFAVQSDIWWQQLQRLYRESTDQICVA